MRLSRLTVFFFGKIAQNPLQSDNRRMNGLSRAVLSDG